MNDVSRRKFIKCTGTIAAGFTILPSHVLGKALVVMGVLAVRLQALNRDLLWDGENMQFTNISDSDKINIITTDDFTITDGHPGFDRRSSEFNAKDITNEWIRHTYHNGFSLPEMPKGSS